MDIHFLIPGTHEHMNDFIDVMTIRNLEVGRLSGIIWVGPN